MICLVGFLIIQVSTLVVSQYPSPDEMTEVPLRSGSARGIAELVVQDYNQKHPSSRYKRFVLIDVKYLAVHNKTIPNRYTLIGFVVKQQDPFGKFFHKYCSALFESKKGVLYNTCDDFGTCFDSHTVIESKLINMAEVALKNYTSGKGNFILKQIKFFERRDVGDGKSNYNITFKAGAWLTSLPGVHSYQKRKCYSLVRENGNSSDYEVISVDCRKPKNVINATNSCMFGYDLCRSVIFRRQFFELACWGLDRFYRPYLNVSGENYHLDSVETFKYTKVSVNQTEPETRRKAMSFYMVCNVTLRDYVSNVTEKKRCFLEGVFPFRLSRYAQIEMKTNCSNV